LGYAGFKEKNIFIEYASFKEKKVLIEYERLKFRSHQLKTQIRKCQNREIENTYAAKNVHK
jgi:hypothetical protein